MHFDDDAILRADPGDPTVIDQISGRHMGVRIDPDTLVCHYTVTPTLDRAIAVQRARTYWANCTIDGYKEGQRSVARLAMSVPFNIRASHAKGYNHRSAGVEIANPGPCWIHDDGVLRTSYGAKWDPADAIETGPVKGYPRQWTHWCRYTDEEMLLLMGIALAMKARKDLFPKFEHITGHHQIDPTRKFDPGPTEDDELADGGPVEVPVFHMRWLRQQVFPEQFADTEPPGAP